MQKKEAPAKTSRAFSKAVLLLNAGLIWGAVYYSIYKGSGGDIIAPAFALLGTLYSGYIGVGHLDYRKVLSTLRGAAATPSAAE